MNHKQVFFLVFASVLVYAWWRGGRPERWAAFLLLAASVATAVIPYDKDQAFRSLDRGGFAVDLALFFALLALALWADRYWPMWIAALQLDVLGFHLLRATNPDVVPLAYAWATNKMAYPIGLLLAIGTLRHRRRELSQRNDP